MQDRIRKGFRISVLGTISCLVLLLAAMLTACSSAVPPAPVNTTPPAVQPPASAPPSGQQTSTPGAKAAAIDGIKSPGEYVSGNTYGDFEIDWRVDAEFIYIFMQAKTGGFVAMGIQPQTTMLNADIILGFVQGGAARVEDTFSTGPTGPHPPDKELGGSNDILEFAGLEQGGVTSIEFKRRLDTGDNYDLPLQPGANKIIWAFGSGDSLDSRHVVRGYGELQL
jgi:hypothetical protein